MRRMLVLAAVLIGCGEPAVPAAPAGTLYLSGLQPGTLLRVDDQGWFVTEARARSETTDRQRGWAGSGGPIDETGHPVALAFGDHRAHLGGLLGGLTHGNLAHGTGQFGDELVVDAVGDVDAGGGHTILAGVTVSALADLGDGQLGIAVVEDQHRGLPAQFQVQTLEVVGAGAGDDFAGGSVTGQ